MSFRYAPWIAFALSVAALGSVLTLWTVSGQPSAYQPVVVHAAAALRPPLQKAAAEFEQDTGIAVELRFDASETLLAKLKVTRQSDLFVPADDSYVTEARLQGLVEQDYPIATLTAVAVFRADFPKDPNQITWEDVFRSDFRLAQPNPDSTAIGKLTRQGLRQVGLWDRIERSKAVSVGTVTEAANAVRLGSADGALIWDSVAAAYPSLKVVRLAHLERVRANVTVAVCRDAEAPVQARRFAEYLSGLGQKHFRDAGYAPPGGPKE
jgi:molybdate transport system substrate-binding protein